MLNLWCLWQNDFLASWRLASWALASTQAPFPFPSSVQEDRQQGHGVRVCFAKLDVACQSGCGQTKTGPVVQSKVFSVFCRYWKESSEPRKLNLWVDVHTLACMSISGCWLVSVHFPFLCLEKQDQIYDGWDWDVSVKIADGDITKTKEINIAILGTGTDLIQSITTNQEGYPSFGHGIDGPSNGWGLLCAINRWLISALVGTPLMWRTKASYWVTQVRIDDARNQGLREVKRRKTLFSSPKENQQRIQNTAFHQSPSEISFCVLPRETVKLHFLYAVCSCTPMQPTCWNFSLISTDCFLSSVIPYPLSHSPVCSFINWQMGPGHLRPEVERMDGESRERRADILDS